MGELLQSVQAWLDPQVIGTFVLQWSGRVFAAIAIFLVGRWIALALTKWLARGLEKARVDSTLTRFLHFSPGVMLVSAHERVHGIPEPEVVVTRRDVHLLQKATGGA